jgi:hypothetical protein
MKSKLVGLMGVAVVLVIAVPLSGQVLTEELNEEFDYDLVSCAPWTNCNTESPNYTGICCRPCRERSRGTIWDCERVRDERVRFGTGSAEGLLAGEATVTGIITREGLLQADQGPEYAVAGEKAGELQSNMGKKIEVKGTVQEAEGKITIDVDAYELLGAGSPATAQTSGSCAQWLNCDSRAPTFTGTCCRQCKDAAGAKFWDCRVFSEGEHFDLAEWTD